GGVFWLTREEGTWIVPSLCVLIAAAIVARGARANQEQRGADRKGAGVATTALAVALGVLTVLGTCAALNQMNYGTWLLNDVKSGTFPAAYGAIQRIETNDRLERMAFTEETARAIEAHSPSARALLAHLRIDAVQGWRAVTCLELELSPCP